MRYLTILVILFTGCATTSGLETIPREETTVVTGYDFSGYTEQGFLFTPEQYLGSYESIGIITITMWPEVRKEQGTEYIVRNGKTMAVAKDKFVLGELNVEKAIDETYQQAKNMGANAITRFDVNSTSRMNGDLLVPGVEISGFAIKRLDAEELSSN